MKLKLGSVTRWLTRVVFGGLILALLCVAYFTQRNPSESSDFDRSVLLLKLGCVLLALAGQISTFNAKSDFEKLKIPLLSSQVSARTGYFIVRTSLVWSAFGYIWYIIGAYDSGRKKTLQITTNEWISSTDIPTQKIEIVISQIVASDMLSWVSIMYSCFSKEHESRYHDFGESQCVAEHSGFWIWRCSINWSGLDLIYCDLENDENSVILQNFGGTSKVPLFFQVNIANCSISTPIRGIDLLYSDRGQDKRINFWTRRDIEDVSRLTYTNWLETSTLESYTDVYGDSSTHANYFGYLGLHPQPWCVWFGEHTPLLYTVIALSVILNDDIQILEVRTQEQIAFSFNEIFVSFTSILGVFLGVMNFLFPRFASKRTLRGHHHVLLRVLENELESHPEVAEEFGEKLLRKVLEKNKQKTVQKNDLDIENRGRHRFANVDFEDLRASLFLEMEVAPRSNKKRGTTPQPLC